MDTVDQVYGRQKKINEDTQRRLFSSKRIVKDRLESAMLKEQLNTLTSHMYKKSN